MQISDENVHHVRELMDEVFGARNFVRMLLFKKTGYLASTLASSNYDYLLWYARDKLRIKHRALYLDKSESASFVGQRLYVEDKRGKRRLAADDELLTVA
jgi:adenine-specific DNA-methyltransferase